MSFLGMKTPNVADKHQIPSGGAKPRVQTSNADKKDRVMDLEKQNNSLKEKSNLLENEVHRM